MKQTYPLSVVELERAGYVEHTVFMHEEIAAFVRTYFFRKNPVTASYLLFNAIVIVMLVLYPIFCAYSNFSLDLFLLGFAGFILLIPVHELIHGIGYKLAGATKVSYRVVWRKFVVYAMADRFVTRRTAFVALALAPFILINTALIILIALTNPAWSSFFTGALVMHTAGCSGDFALVSYFYTFWNRNPVTYDEEMEGRTVFMVRTE